MSEALFISTMDNLAAAPHQMRCYIGHPTCRKLAWEWAERLPLATPVTLVLPPLRPCDDAPLAALLCRLRQIPCEGLELSLNDWGTLVACAQALAGTRVVLCAGILLAGQDTDPRIAGFLNGADQPARDVMAPDGSPARLVYAPPPDTLITHWQTPSIIGALPLLARWGVRRVELCIPSAGFAEDFPAGFAVSMYSPRVLLSMRPCADCENCPQERRQLGVLGDRKVLQCRNMIYYTARIIEGPPYADRLVLF